MSDIGLIEAGRFADMVYVTADPLADVRVLQDLQHIGMVMKGGAVVVDRREPQRQAWVPPEMQPVLT
jgi:imidazolonepropionase-like amidohydrolase